MHGHCQNPQKLNENLHLQIILITILVITKFEWLTFHVFIYEHADNVQPQLENNMENEFKSNSYIISCFFFFHFNIGSPELPQTDSKYKVYGVSWQSWEEVKQENKTITTGLTITPVSRLNSNPHF